MKTLTYKEIVRATKPSVVTPVDLLPRDTVFAYVDVKGFSLVQGRPNSGKRETLAQSSDVASIGSAVGALRSEGKRVVMIYTSRVELAKATSIDSVRALNIEGYC